ncbi:hypothetical protein BAUCODRAFT_149628 [Baudoinia panamericana UAMH 10762]|uniref:Myb-like domain-containing protein n=1 Tax=Baudoinia panamericana (strain UAMH 10762) TaxID=717646 RepID=M2LJT3_BAUPA|nr:uncharacterized protein BAUCODRAFT_149628 [Baudoinia panamericana UAMH 10762]EMC94482.1 hypothetical protein BAUCODRAFT_149628 [Baudoinia panamericana UAMH 10762]
MADGAPQHSYFADEMYHHDIEQGALYGAFRPLYPPVSSPAAVPIAQAQTSLAANDVQIPVPGVIDRYVDARAYSAVSYDDWARASIDYDATSPASVETRNDHPATPGADTMGSFAQFHGDSRPANSMYLEPTADQHCVDFKPAPMALASAAIPIIFRTPDYGTPAVDSFSGVRYSSFRGLAWPAQPVAQQQIMQVNPQDVVQCSRQAAPVYVAPQAVRNVSADTIDSLQKSSEEYSSSESATSPLPTRTASTSDSVNVKWRNRMIVQLRSEGLSYKDIRKRLNLRCAESTIRGIYRNMTKPKAERIRQPQWTANDVQLLRRAVAYYTPAARSVKLPWQSIARHVQRHGGSYPFAGAACAKKWKEV